MTTAIQNPGRLLAYIGQDLGTSSGLEVPQADINLFAQAIYDDQ